MDIQYIPITNLIPQRHPFIMIDSVLQWDENNALTKYQVKDDNVFYNENNLAAEGIIENMAQSCAALLGIESMNSCRTRQTCIGVVCQIHNCTIESLPFCNEILFTEVHIKENIFNMCTIEASAKVSNRTIATSQLKLAIIQD